MARSRDRGESWEDISGPSSTSAYPDYNDPAGILPYQMGKHEDGRVYRDVHLVIRHPVELDILYATTGIGTYITHDSGQYWSKAEYGMGRAYAIPTVIHPPARQTEFFSARPKMGRRLGKDIARFARDPTTRFVSAAILRRRPAALIRKSCAATMAAKAGAASTAVCRQAIRT